MPSYVIHLAYAKKILKYCECMLPEETKRFYLGSIAADMVSNKKQSHFWNDETYRHLERKPNLSGFIEHYKNVWDDPYVFGYYGHLYLDRMFLERYWDRHFLFFNENKQPETEYDAVRYVKVLEQNRIYDRDVFFSKELYYGDYDRMNAFFIESYALDFPDMIPDLDWIMAHMGELSCIREIDWNESLPILKESIARVKKSIIGAEAQTPPLNIFLLPELEVLIDFAAREMSKNYKNLQS